MRRASIRSSLIFYGAVGLPGFQAAHALAERLLEGSADSHHFADAFHLRAEDGLGAREFFELPARDFHDDVVDGRLKTRGRLARDVVLDFVQAIADGELRRDLGDGEARGLRGERGAARHARVHLDNDHTAGFRIDGELDVGAAGIDADFAQTGQRAIAHHLIFAVGERLRGRDGDGIARVDAHRVEIFDGADDDGVVGEVAHHLELEFLPAKDALFDEDFVDRRKIDAALQNFFGFFAVIGDAAAGAAHGETGAQNDGIADARGELQALLDRVHELRLRQFEPDLLHRVFEEQPVFRFLDGIDFRADQFDAVLIENARFGESHRQVQAGLAADSGKQRVGTLAANDFFGVFDAQGFDIRAVGEVRIRHDGGRIRIDQHHFVAVRLSALQACAPE